MATALTTTPPAEAVRALWSSFGGAPEALARLALTGNEPVLRSSFAVGTAAQASSAAAALAASEIGRVRNGELRHVSVDMADAAAECSAYFRIDGRQPEAWDPLAGLYRCGDGWVRLHTNFAHHRDGVLRLLGLPTDGATTREQVAAALADRDAEAFESEATAAGLVVAAMRSFAAWQRHPQHAADAASRLIDIERIGDGPPLAWPTLHAGALPLSGLRIVDQTRILAGPVATRTLAAHGADVMLVNSPQLPNIAALADTSRGKRSALADLRLASDRDAFAAVLGHAHAVVQSYRPGALDSLGFGPSDVARLRPGIVYTSLSAYAHGGPWHEKRGFDSLVQTATGLNDDEAHAFSAAAPQALPVQILDMAAAFLLAFGTEAALLRQQREGGSWHVRVSLARTALWLRSLGRLPAATGAPALDLAARTKAWPSGFGRLEGIKHGARLSTTNAAALRRSMPPGRDPLRWD